MELGSTEGFNKAGKAQLASTMAQGLYRLDVLFNGFGRCPAAERSICPLTVSLASHHVFSPCFLTMFSHYVSGLSPCVFIMCSHCGSTSQHVFSLCLWPLLTMCFHGCSGFSYPLRSSFATVYLYVVTGSLPTYRVAYLCRVQAKGDLSCTALAAMESIKSEFPCPNDEGNEAKALLSLNSNNNSISSWAVHLRTPSLRSCL